LPATDVTIGAVSSYLAISPLSFRERKDGMFLLHFPYAPVFTGAPWALPSILPGGARTFLILPAKREGRGHPVYLTPMKSITEGLVSQLIMSIPIDFP